MNRKTLIRKLKIFEKKLSSRNTKQIEKMFKEFKKIVEQDNSDFIEIKGVKIDMEKFKQLAKKYLYEMFIFNVKSTIKTYSQLFGWEIERTKVKGIKDRMLKEYLKKYSAKKVKQISDTTYKQLNSVITELTTEGLSFPSIVKRVTSKVDEMSLGRAKTIARTETASAINNTSFRTAKVAKMKQKGWIHIGGRYTSRENHRRLNGMWINMDELWDLGTARCSGPHDPGLPASEVCNCNCLQIYR